MSTHNGDAAVVRAGHGAGMKLIAACLFVLAVPFAIARADHGRHQPPQAAFDACAKSKAGDSCSVTFGDHTITGTCAQGRDGSGPLHCRPYHHH